MQVRKLYRVIDIDSSSILWQCKEKLSSLFADTLKGIIYKTYSIIGDEDR